MAEPLLSDPTLAVPGAWLASVHGLGSAHFFEETEERSLCGGIPRDLDSWRTCGARGDTSRCVSCVNALSKLQARLDEELREPEPEAPAIPNHALRAKRLRRRASREPNRFRRVFILSEALRSEILARPQVAQEERERG